MNTEGRHQRSERTARTWKQWVQMILGVVVLVVGVYTFVDYYRFTQCQETVNEEAAHVDNARGAAFRKSIDAQIRVAETLLDPQRTTPQQSRQALVDYRNSLLEQRQIRDAFERPEPAKCR